MRIAFFVNSIATEKSGYTTNYLACEAINRGHKAWVIQASNFFLDQHDEVIARAYHAPGDNYEDPAKYLEDLQSDSAIQQDINVGDLDVLFLRSDPSIERGMRRWAAEVGIYFGRLAMRHGVIVVNDPEGLSMAMNKTYLELFPESVRPRNVITRSPDAVKAFAQQEGQIVVKPLQGSGGQGVFLIGPENMSNLNQIVEVLTKEGYVIAQEFLPEARDGDVRLFLMNGEPLKIGDAYAGFKRVSKSDDIRNNVSAGGSIEAVEINDEMLHLAEVVRPKLIQDGMFFVGLDVVGNKLMEINVFSPGGIGSVKKVSGVDFSGPVIEALERKVDCNTWYARDFDNKEMATTF